MQSPFDPCRFVLRHPVTGNLEGILGLHVDDGLCEGSQYFSQKLAKLESKHPFGSKRIKQLTFTGIEMDYPMAQLPCLNPDMYEPVIPSKFPLNAANKPKTKTLKMKTKSQRIDRKPSICRRIHKTGLILQTQHAPIINQLSNSKYPDHRQSSTTRSQETS